MKKITPNSRVEQSKMKKWSKKWKEFIDKELDEGEDRMKYLFILSDTAFDFLRNLRFKDLSDGGGSQSTKFGYLNFDSEKYNGGNIHFIYSYDENKFYLNEYEGIYHTEIKNDFPVSMYFNNKEAKVISEIIIDKFKVGNMLNDFQIVRH